MKKIFTIHFFCVLAMNSFTIHSQLSRFEPVNGIVRASVLNTTTGILYIGGDFTAVNTYITGGGAIISAATGLPEVNWPEIDGAVLASVSDGAGGWYIRGLLPK